MHAGPLGSTIHVLRADAGTIAELAAIDWNSSFRRVCLDPVGGLIVLMTPSRLHEELATMLDHIVDIAASTLGRGVKGLLASRLREPGAPPGTGLEPDCAFYVGRTRPRLSGGPGRGQGRGRRVLRADPARPGRRSRDHERRPRQDRAVRRSRRAGAVALPRPRRRRQPCGGLPRPARPRRPPAPRGLERPRRPHARRRARSRERHAAQPDPRRAHRGRGPHRPPPPTRERAGPGREGALFGAYRGRPPDDAKRPHRPGRAAGRRLSPALRGTSA